MYRVCPIISTLLFIYHLNCSAQLKFIIEDFEGFANGVQDLHKNGVFDYGNIRSSVQKTKTNSNDPFYIEDRFLTVKKEGKEDYGGWGKGISMNVELDQSKDHLNLYLQSNVSFPFKITLQEDDDHSNAFEKDKDDEWIFEVPASSYPAWKLLSVPLNEFKDNNNGGDGIFNCTYAEGKLLCFIITFQKGSVPAGIINFDFICFSEGQPEEPITGNKDSFCSLGLWSEEGNKADFYGIASAFENLFGKEKKPAVIHFFQPFYSNNSNVETSIESIEKLIGAGYVPMITLEDRYVNTIPGPQPNLYSITEGHFDFFFTQWAKRIKQLNSIVLVRILHEFNGDWYPWCTIKNDRNPEMVIKAFHHIRNIFRREGADNAKFIWCPNSMSVPQEPWNFIMKAYPGDEYVDIVGLDVYNGSGVGSGNWRSFRKEAIENYFLLTKNFPSKPFIICETASRERKRGENGDQQEKEEWILQMTRAVQNDLDKIKLLCWFNEKEYFMFDSSPASKEAYLNAVIKNVYFKSGSAEFLNLVK